MPETNITYNRIAEIKIMKLLFDFSIFVFFILLPAACLNSQNLSVKQDTSKQNSVISDTLKKSSRDSVINHVPLFRHGSNTITTDYSYKRISKHDLLWNNYMGMYDVLTNILPSYPMSLGGYLNYNQLSMFGGSSRDNSFRFNNRPINELPFGTFNIEEFPTEFIENAEVFVGSDAVIFSGNSSGSLVNFTEPRYNASKPYSKLWINEAGTTFIASDGIFSQNIFPNTNLTFGFRKINSKGEYENQSVDGWNLRGLLRFNLSDYTSISISEIFYNQYNEMNGGINKSLSSDAFNPVDAVVNYSSFSDRQIRHDQNLTFSSILSKDTSSAVSLTLFSTISNWTRILDSRMSNILNDSSASVKFPSNEYGLTGKYEQGIFHFARLIVGGDINYSYLPKSLFNAELKGFNYSAFGHIAFDFDEKLSITGGLRLNSQLNKFYNSLGGKILYTFVKTTSQNYSVFGDLSVSQRIPTPSENLSLKNENHLLAIFGLDFNSDKFNLNSSVWYRAIDNPVVYSLISDSANYVLNTVASQGSIFHLSGLNLSLEFPLSKRLIINVRTNLVIDNKKGSFLSNIQSYSVFDAYYKFLAGASELRIGINVAGIFQNHWNNFYPQSRTFIVSDEPSKFFYNGINLYAHAKLGIAYFKINVLNLLGSGYYYTANYPGVGRVINFSVNWPFLN